ncbi:glycoside hydrolase family 30 protein [Paenibacillus lactis]|uniref:glycoside hydrolase family 30 protein n=1 Tax=Paenibacillus lactis TaxID=228574 RepID=UPI001B228697|nr:glycoside hydrolase family 30 beta sandwich domain-containing protein [Paenibacillus lactis]GIO91354.1 glucosylceramidase [Paenibacillus lactis]
MKLTEKTTVLKGETAAQAVTETKLLSGRANKPGSTQRRRRFLLSLLLLVLLLLICSIAIPPGTEDEISSEVWLTTGDQTNLLTQKAPVAFTNQDSSQETPNIKVNPEIRYQTMDGFGAAITGSSAYLINHTMTEAQRSSLLGDLFTEDGIRLSFVRHTIGASDFSVDEQGRPSSYTYDDIESGMDYGMEHFSIAKDADVVSLLQNMLKKNHAVKILGTPWTAPPWMKYGEKTYNGWYLDYTNPKVYAAYADYFVKYIQAYEASGIPIYGLTVQNEPAFTSPDYPSMSMGAEEQARFIRDYLGPAFTKQGIGTKIIAFDHNWGLGEAYARQVFGDAGAASYIDGTAYHCYEGSAEAMSAVHHDFPDKNIYLTECSGGQWSPDFGDNLSWQMDHLIIGAPRNAAKTVLFWNLALDPSGGPTNGGCKDCRGVITVNPATGDVEKNVEYYALGHASKFVDPGAVRIASTRYKGKLETVAYENPDGSLVLIGANPGAEELPFSVEWNGKAFSYSLPPQSAVTFKWLPGSGSRS